MEFGAILLLLVVLMVVILFVARPLTGQRFVRSYHEQKTSSLLAERERILNALQELDFDQTLGKIPADEYPSQRSQLLAKGAAVLRQLDELKDTEANAPEEDLEAAISKRRAAVTSGKGSLSDDEIEDLVAKRRTGGKDKAAGFCPRCGKPVLRSDQFCPSCGKALN